VALAAAWVPGSFFLPDAQLFLQLFLQIILLLHVVFFLAALIRVPSPLSPATQD
jgi:hypothetical protein